MTIQTDLFGQPIPLPVPPAVPVEKPKRVGERILDYFKDHRFESFTVYQIHLMLGQQYPMESVRTALQRLVMSAHLVLTGEQRPGLYGDKSQCYRYSKTKRVWKR